MTGETPGVRSDKRKPREDRENHRYHRYHRYHRKTTYIGRNAQNLTKLPTSSSKLSLQELLSELTKANAHLYLDNSSLNKCPKPSWQAFRPPQTANAQIDRPTFPGELP